MVPLIGRTVELAQTGLLVKDLPAQGHVLVIVGEAGIGKTALLQETGEHAAALGRSVVEVTAIELEATLPFAALQQILHAFPRHLQSMRAKPRDVLERAVGLTTGATPDAFAVAVAFLEVLTDEAGEGLLLIVDDAQWLDSSSALALTFAARRLLRDPASILFALRSGHDSVVLEAGFDRMDLQPLSEKQSLEVLRSRRPALTGLEQTRIIRAAEGNPLALLELPPSHSDDTDPLSSRLRNAFVARLQGLTAESTGLLLAAALGDINTVLDLRAVAEALAFDEEAFRMCLVEFSTTRTLDVQGASFRFRHPLIRSAVLSMSDSETRRRTHAALAKVLANDPDRSVWHEAANAMGWDESLASRMEDAAIRMERRGSAGTVVQAWAIATRLTADEAMRARRSIRMAESALMAGMAVVALESLKTVDKDVLDDVGRARWALVRLRADPHTADRTELHGLLGNARRLLEKGEIDLVVSLALTVGENLDAGGYDTRRDLSDVAERIAGSLPDGDIRGLVVRAAADRVAYGEDIARAMMTLDPDEFSEKAELLTRLPPNVDADPVIARLQRRLLDTYRERGQLRAIANLQPTHAWVEIALADWPEALHAIQEGTRLASEIGYARWSTGTLIGAAFISAVRGEHEDAIEMIEESERGAIAAGANNVLTGVQLTKGVNYIAQGRYDEAFTALRRPFDVSDPSYHPIQTGWSLGDLAETAYHLGRIDEVSRYFVHASDAPTSPWQRMAEMYAAPFLATDPGAADKAFSSALEGLVGNWPIYRVRLLVEYGSWLRRHARISEARDRLREARDLADALSVRPWSERARQELRAAGAESAPVEARAWESLSPQELEVAQLAAQGLSNREIGERLFLSHRTVGSHLYRIFPKLNISNRAQLSAALRSTGVPRTRQEPRLSGLAPRASSGPSPLLPANRYR